MHLFSTAYFPCTAYMSALAGTQEAKIELWETYPKQTYRNRAIIATANGLLPLTIPVTKTNGNHTLTKDITICYKENWQIRHWRAIEAAYNSSPYFLYYHDDVKKLIFGNYKFLIDINMDILTYIIEKLKLKIAISTTEDFLPTNSCTDDFRNVFSPKAQYNNILTPYPQIFEDRFGFQQNLSIMDLLFNMGPESAYHLT